MEVWSSGNNKSLQEVQYGAGFSWSPITRPAACVGSLCFATVAAVARHPWVPSTVQTGLLHASNPELVGFDCGESARQAYDVVACQQKLSTGQGEPSRTLEHDPPGVSPWLVAPRPVQAPLATPKLQHQQPLSALDVEAVSIPCRGDPPPTIRSAIS